MKRIHLLLSCLFCFLFISGVCHAQRKNSPKVLQSNFIKSAHTYSFLVRDGKINQDSTLSVIRKYNKHGRSTHTKLHDSLGVAYMTYEYLYKDDDTTYLGRNVFANPSYKLLYSTEVKYNKKGLLIKSTDSRPGQASKSGAIHKYNQLNQLTDITFNQNGAKSAPSY